MTTCFNIMTQMEQNQSRSYVSSSPGGGIGGGAKSDVYDCPVIGRVCSDDGCRRVWSENSRRESDWEIHWVRLGGHPRCVAVARRAADWRPISLFGDCHLGALAAYVRSLSHVRTFHVGMCSAYSEGSFVISCTFLLKENTHLILKEYVITFKKLGCHFFTF